MLCQNVKNKIPLTQMNLAVRQAQGRLKNAGVAHEQVGSPSSPHSQLPRTLRDSWMSASGGLEGRVAHYRLRQIEAL